MRRSWIGLGFLLAAWPLGAQTVGDSIRVRSDAVTNYGRFVAWTPPTMVTLQDPLGEWREIAIPDDGRVEVWKPSNLARDLFLNIVGGFAIGAVLYDEDRPPAYSRAETAAISVGLAGC